ncbi:S-layer homology domain-containing protein [Gracilibacillus ureilyticus]|uniref:S-layer homology domain-containing protein n=1 Tax=Gracilibacillus ureilyticus TaxID=531814 RepID=A0A1H9NMZ5_9BACI|nr:S-layer homology domain-containing protein [Gracilibacillus ureilyticus]SER37272.1 S-layer homology domain-containing protein [Gracilibacillus ureilyticus]
MHKKVIALITAGISISVLATFSPADISAEEQQSDKVMEETGGEIQSIDQQEALQIAEEFFGVNLANAEFYYDQNWYRNNLPVWSISYEKETAGKGLEYFYITIDAVNGDIVNTGYDVNSGEGPSVYPPEISWEDGKVTAGKIVDKYFSNWKDMMKPDSSTEPHKPALSDQAVYTYRYNRVIDGVELPNNHVEVNVSGNNELISFNSTWDYHIELESNPVKYTKQEALSHFQQKLPVDIQYSSLNRYYRPANDGSGEMILEYALNENYPYLDAFTGEWINRRGETTSQAEEINQESIVKKPLEPNRMIQSIMTEDEAEKFARDVVNIPDDMVVENIQYFQNESQPVTWGLTFSQANEGGNNPDVKRIDLRINATTGEIYNYYAGGMQTIEEMNSEEVNISYEEAKNRAEEIVKKFAPEKAHKVYLENIENGYREEAGIYHFMFQRKENGIPVKGDAIEVRISSSDGTLLDFYQSWQNNVTFPSLENVISKESAFERFLERYEVDLGWKMIQSEFKEEEEEHYRKVYYLNDLNVFDQAVYLNAKTGKWHSRLTDEIVTVNPEANDITGLPEEEALKLMIAYGALTVDENGDVHPEKTVTRGEMVKMLMLANNPDPVYYYDMGAEYANSEGSFDDVSAGNEYFSYVEEAIRQGFLDKDDENFKPNQLVTRLELAELLVHALEYDKIANYGEMFQHPYEDITTKEQSGYVAIVHYLDIMPTESNKFLPDQHVSRAEAAQIFYQYLTVRGTLD